MSNDASREAHHRVDPQMPTMISARLIAVSAGLLVALAGGVLAANAPSVGPATAVTTVHQQPV